MENILLADGVGSNLHFRIEGDNHHHDHYQIGVVLEWVERTKVQEILVAQVMSAHRPHGLSVVWRVSQDNNRREILSNGFGN